jgi:catechol 2,3-dioxygenase-like lactoylglutathione lyase family enzyme
MFKAIHPILGTRDLQKAIDFYTDRLGFKLAFGDASNYAGLRRDAAEVHIQFQYEHEMSTTRLRVFVDDPDALYEEYKPKEVFHEGTHLASTSWGTREFAIYDLDRNALTFYRNLTKAELQQRA